MIVGIDEERQMVSDLFVSVVVAFNDRILDRSVHSFDLTVVPRVIHLDHPVLDLMFGTDATEDVLPVPDIPMVLEPTTTPRGSST